MARRRTRTGALVVGVAALVLAAVTGCTSAAPPASTPTPRPHITSVPSLNKWLADGDPVTYPKPIAKANGALHNDMDNTTVNATAQILSITVGRSSTDLVWQLRTSDGSSVDVSSIQMSEYTWADTRLLGLVDPAKKTTYHPYTFVPPQSAGGMASGCVCSPLQFTPLNGAGTIMHATLPALPAGLKSVTVTMPGFSDMKDVPVHRSDK